MTRNASHTRTLKLNDTEWSELWSVLREESRKVEETLENADISTSEERYQQFRYGLLDGIMSQMWAKRN